MSVPILVSDVVSLLPNGTTGGVARYFGYVLQGITDCFGERVVVSTSRHRSYGSARYFSYPPVVARPRVHDIVTSALSFWVRPGVFFSPYYGNAVTGGQEIFTVYDMIHELFPQYFAQYQRGWRSFVAEKQRCLSRATKIIAISHNTARDIIACYPHIDAGKIVVIHLGIDKAFFDVPAASIDFVVERPFFLYVGRRSLYKNFTQLLTAFGQSGLAGDYELRVVSTEGDFSAEERAIIQRYKIEGAVTLLQSVDDALLRAHYAQATAFVYPSLYEGFGLPVLEAMASGALTIAARVSSIPEVAGKPVWYFDPHDPESLRHTLQLVANSSPTERALRVQQGRLQASLFTWNQCVQQTVELIDKLA